MDGNEAIPRRLYKYRAFSNRTLDMIVRDKLHFADPSTFNDPLDVRPHVQIDVGVGTLETILRKLVEQRVTAEMRAAAKTMRVGGGRADAHIERASGREADRLIAEIEYHATNPEYDDAVVAKRGLFRREINGELLRQYDRGIVSLAERADCPLMWSHYGDQHCGVCLGYSVPEEAAGQVQRVRYGGSRVIEVSKVAAMLEGDHLARREVDEAVLLRKAGSWAYEREWRLLGVRGFNDSPLELEEIVFGMRCESSVQYGVMKALEDRERPVGFCELHVEPGAFDLKTFPLSYDDEMFVHFPDRHLSVFEMFEALPDVSKDGAD